MTRERFISEVRACQGRLRRFLTSLCGDPALATALGVVFLSGRRQTI